MHSLGLVKTRIDQGLDHGTKIRLFSRHNNIFKVFCFSRHSPDLSQNSRLFPDFLTWWGPCSRLLFCSHSQQHHFSGLIDSKHPLLKSRNAQIYSRLLFCSHYQQHHFSGLTQFLGGTYKY